jgi:hypothetical protein
MMNGVWSLQTAQFDQCDTHDQIKDADERKTAVQALLPIQAIGIGSVCETIRNSNDFRHHQHVHPSHVGKKSYGSIFE